MKKTSNRKKSTDHGEDMRREYHFDSDVPE